MSTFVRGIPLLTSAGTRNPQQESGTGIPPGAYVVCLKLIHVVSNLPYTLHGNRADVPVPGAHVRRDLLFSFFK